VSRLGALAVVVAAAAANLGCSVGEGEGWVRSDRLYIEDCVNGKFDLGPDFFGANSFRGDALVIRVQRGDDIEELSDGLTIVVNDLPTQRARVGQAIAVGMPVGVSPPGVPVVYNANPPPVSLALYLHESCHVELGTVYSIDGTITFKSLFSGDPNEEKSEDRLTDATFDATFADPRQLVGPGADDPDLKSRVTGHFRFFFQRGQPAQPFN
jgi:hypothetical protein